MKYSLLILAAASSLRAASFIDGGSLSGWTTSSNQVHVVAPGGSFNTGWGGFSTPSSASSFGITNYGQITSNVVGPTQAEAAFGLSSGTISNAIQWTTDYGYVSRSFSFVAGVTYSFGWNYFGNDDPGLLDGAFFALSGQGSQVFSVLALNNFYNAGTSTIAGGGSAFANTISHTTPGETGWQETSFTVGITGTYQFSVGSFNHGDFGVPPMLMVNAGTGGAVPEPSTYGLALGGLALVGAVIRRRRSK